MWLGYMAFHKYFNYTGLIKIPLCEEDIGLATYSTVLLHSIMMLLSHFSNDRPAKCLVCLNDFL